jgi:heme oxygenase (biliverdin-IX-beta and delta-forming)
MGHSRRLGIGSECAIPDILGVGLIRREVPHAVVHTNVAELNAFPSKRPIRAVFGDPISEPQWLSKLERARRKVLLNAACRSFKGSIRYLLRSATATNHAQVDERIAELIGQGEAGYREFLRLSAVAIRPLEESLSAANVECILPDWRERSRWASLRADLADLGMTPAPAAPVPRLDGEAYQFGVLYVLEGSRLGANVLLRRLLAMPSLPPLRALRYLRHGEGHPLWHTFLERLESSAAVRRSPMEAIAGAKAAFRFFLPM